jgi:class 3 adenylate cyclase/putative methionine-R-sulfoxide reductase with GAF domain
VRTQDIEVRLEDIPSCFEGVIPAAISTVADDGTPNVTYISVVQRVDSEHVALSRQFFKKTDDNTRVNPYAQVCLIEPETGRLFLLDLVYERTETEGPLFERMRTKLDAIAAHEGLENVFKLRGTDICLVEACTMLHSVAAAGPPRRDVRIERVEEFSRHIADVEDMDDLLSTMLRACAELLGYDHVFVMLVDETGDRLYTVASAGFPTSGAGSEVRIGEGLIGVAAERHQSVRVTHMARELSYSHAARESTGQEEGGVEDVIALPRLQSVQSQLVTPMLAYRRLVGVLCLQSEVPGAFQAADECVAGILANQVAMAMATLRKTEGEVAEAPAALEAETVEVRHYEEDDSVFLDNEYLIKGVAGGILWRLLRNYDEHGRVEFSNREIRLDQTLDLPDIKDNLEARLILLRKRLEERCDYLRIEKSARGRFRLRVEKPLALVQVAGGGPLSDTRGTEPARAGGTAVAQHTLPSGTAVILFADIVGSTALTERLGDSGFRERARRLDVALRNLIRENGGTPVEGKLLGDGVLAVFTSARQAIEAALRCAQTGDSAGLPLHVGLHAGDVIREHDNVYGGAVNIASRVSALAPAGEVLVSDIVRGLARTSSGVTFEDMGEQLLKGVGEPVRVWRVGASIRN